MQTLESENDNNNNNSSNKNSNYEKMKIKQDNKFHKIDSGIKLIPPKFILVLISEFAWFLIIVIVVLST